ncbi:gamma-glutamylcyclotransferase [Rathayibacter caricis]|uniref:gamma-glutamylcyclotransferase family protein n=1 Tax=Rathayibacter caricis TaxID=110936 RepID=UPI001FB35AAC|nr:gamma-glutamylcyclotransferase family protein [Rathayibacter caricis]MCJ1695964.1 gamma-glutamylcyclotransferase [Rathayibacter caricis]
MVAQNGRTGPSNVPVFSYGSLAREEFQRSFFGRLVPAAPARLRGFRVQRVPIAAEDLLPTDREPFRWIALATAESDATVAGFVVRLSMEQLMRVDEFEAPDYRRRRVRIDDGSWVWLYLPSTG